MIGGSPICWSSKQQTVVALSSCESEYLACSHAGKQILWLRNLMLELGYPQNQPSPLFCDNQGTVQALHDPTQHSRMKHINIREHFIRDLVNSSLIDIIHVSNSENPADLFTKPLGRVLHQRWCHIIRLDVDQGGVSSIDPVSSIASITL
jgi:hypothetical protein